MSVNFHGGQLGNHIMPTVQLVRRTFIIHGFYPGFAELSPAIHSI